MGKARHPKPYVDAPAKQITVPWKRRVLAKLASNKEAKIRPWNIDQLRLEVDAKKGGLNKTFDLEREPPQLTSKYADQITELLKILPPLVETDEDDEDFVEDVLLLRTLTRGARRDLMALAKRTEKRS